MKQMEKQPFLNTAVNNVSWDEAGECVEHLIRRKEPSYVVEVNVDVILKIEKNARLREITNQADMVLVDGQPLMWISWLLGRPIQEKISGSDLMPFLCKAAAEKKYRVFILGGKEGVGAQAKARLEESYPGICVSGTYAPPLGFENDPQELEKIDEIIRQARPDLLFACLGCPKQELWTAEHYRKCGAKVTICAGAAVDFVAGKISRAPQWMQRCGMEWFYRFLKEPRRLFKRYFVDDLEIFRVVRRYYRQQKK